MTKAMKDAIISRVTDSMRMMEEATSIDECSSAYVRANDALAQLHIGLLKDKMRQDT